MYRVSQADDPFVYLPPADPFHHIGTEVYYKGDTTDGYRICDGSGEDPACEDSNGRGDVAGLLLKCAIPQECGHLWYLRPTLTFSISGGSCPRKLHSEIMFP